MKHKIGTVLMILGTALVLAALSLLVYNQHEAASAEKASMELLPQLIAQMEQEPTAQELPTEPVFLDTTMDTVEVGGQDYIGYLTIPILELELPIMSDWSYPQLRTAPCRYTGTVGGNDLVLMAHNYPTHFGPLSGLHSGDLVYFRDVHGVTTEYAVAAVDILMPDAVEEMTAGDYDLSLFTCTYGGKSRVTVRCNRT